MAQTMGTLKTAACSETSMPEIQAVSAESIGIHGGPMQLGGVSLALTGYLTLIAFGGWPRSPAVSRPPFQQDS